MEVTYDPSHDRGALVLGRAFENASRELPTGYTLWFSVSSDTYSTVLRLPDGTNVPIKPSLVSFEQIPNAVEIAILSDLSQSSVDICALCGSFFCFEGNICSECLDAITDWKNCYECDRSVSYLFDDGRCGRCTRLTPEEVRGEVDQVAVLVTPPLSPLEWTHRPNETPPLSPMGGTGVQD